MAESKVTKIKKKKWIRVIAPSLFKNEQMGEVPVSETNSLIGRAITVNLMSLTRDMRKQNTSIKFIISHIKGENASTEIYGYYLNAASIKRLVRRGKEKIGLTVICKTSDNKKIRMMPLIIPHNKVKGSVSAAFKKSAREFITSYVSKITFEETIRDLITNKLQKETKTALKKIYPVRILEVAKMHLEKSKKPLDQNVNVIDLTSSKDEDEEMDEDIEEETKEDIEETDENQEEEKTALTDENEEVDEELEEVDEELEEVDEELEEEKTALTDENEGTNEEIEETTEELEEEQEEVKKEKPKKKIFKE